MLALRSVAVSKCYIPSLTVMNMMKRSQKVEEDFNDAFFYSDASVCVKQKFQVKCCIK
jgi:hypothetical protein